MIQRLLNSRHTQAFVQLTSWAQGLFAPALLRRRTFRAAFIASLLAVIYWGFVASDRYVSEAHVVIQRTDLSSGQTMDFSSLLTGIGGTNLADQMLLRDYLLSVDMLQKLDARLDLRAHYSDSKNDLLSRMWGHDLPMELFHNYYLDRVNVEYDTEAGVLVIKAQGYTPEMAQAITTALVEEGEKYMNVLAHRLAEDQVTFLEQQVSQRAEDALSKRKALLAFQNDKKLVSPQSTAESIEGSINQMQSRLIELKATRSARLGYLSPKAPGIVELDLQIKAIERQIKGEQAQLTSRDGAPLNEMVEEYQRLQMAAEFAEATYKTALAALEKGRVEATRTLKKVSILSAPTKPQYPMEPRRIYNIVVFMFVALMIAGVVHLMAAIIRDHKD